MWILVLIVVICAYKWLKWKIVGMALTYYMIEKGYEEPSKEEMKACIQTIANQIFKRQ